MPQKRGKGRKGRRTARRLGLTRVQARAVTKIAQKVEKKNEEVKYVMLNNNTLGTQAGYGTPRAQNLTYLLTQGTGGQQMIGRAANLGRLTLKALINRAPPASDTYMLDVFARVMLVWMDNQTTSASGLSLADIFFSGSYVSGSIGSANAQVDYTKVRVVYDKVIKLTPNAPNHTVSTQLSISKDLKKKITFSSDSTGYSNQDKGNLYFIVIPDCISNNATTTSYPNVVVQYTARLSYRDS